MVSCSPDMSTHFLHLFLILIKNGRTLSLVLLWLQETPLHYTLNILGKRKMDKEVVVLMYNGISLRHEINVIRLVAAR